MIALNRTFLIGDREAGSIDGKAISGFGRTIDRSHLGVGIKNCQKMCIFNWATVVEDSSIEGWRKLCMLFVLLVCVPWANYKVTLSHNTPFMLKGLIIPSAGSDIGFMCCCVLVTDRFNKLPVLLWYWYSVFNKSKPYVPLSRKKARNKSVPESAGGSERGQKGEWTMHNAADTKPSAGAKSCPSQQYKSP